MFTGSKDGTGDTHYFQVIANQGFRDEIMLHGQQFIALLKDDHLRSPVVELLSILSTDIESLSPFQDSSGLHLILSVL
jgi:hypothetical protein